MIELMLMDIIPNFGSKSQAYKYTRIQTKNNNQPEEANAQYYWTVTDLVECSEMQADARVECEFAVIVVYLPERLIASEAYSISLDNYQSI